MGIVKFVLFIVMLPVPGQRLASRGCSLHLRWMNELINEWRNHAQSLISKSSSSSRGDKKSVFESMRGSGRILTGSRRIGRGVSPARDGRSTLLAEKCTQDQKQSIWWTTRSSDVLWWDFPDLTDQWNHLLLVPIPSTLAAEADVVSQVWPILVSRIKFWKHVVEDSIGERYSEIKFLLFLPRKLYWLMAAGPGVTRYLLCNKLEGSCGGNPP